METRRNEQSEKAQGDRLRGVPMVRPNKVWNTDINYIRLVHGVASLVAIIDWCSRCVLSWRISNSTEAEFCVDPREVT